MSSDRSPTMDLRGFLALYAALYAAYGTESAYMPAFLLSHGLPVERIGLVLAAGTIVRIASGTVIGKVADRLQGRKEILTAAAALSGLVGWAYLVAFGFLPLLAVSLAHATATASLAPLSDALAVAAASKRPGFQYGWVRGVGSTAFICGTLFSGQLVDRFGLYCIIAASGVLFLTTALCAARVDASQTEKASSDLTKRAFRFLWTITAYRRLIFVAALVIGSHAVNDAFAVITWRAAGHSSGAISLLWSESVAAEVASFLLVGPWLLNQLGSARCAGLAASAGVLRWSVMGTTLWMPALVGVQALHGFTFALLHMVAMRIIATAVPEPLAATAQSFYGAFALGVASAALTLASGYLYGYLGLRSYWAMAGLCALALPMVGGLVASPSGQGAPSPSARPRSQRMYEVMSNIW